MYFEIAKLKFISNSCNNEEIVGQVSAPFALNSLGSVLRTCLKKKKYKTNQSLFTVLLHNFSEICINKKPLKGGWDKTRRHKTLHWISSSNELLDKWRATFPPLPFTDVKASEQRNPHPSKRHGEPATAWHWHKHNLGQSPWTRKNIEKG